MWERHAVLFTLEGPDDEILVMRGRPHATVPPDWADRAYRVVNEWNHTRRFCKAYVGDPTERGQLPIYAEMQVPLRAGAHDALLVEMLDCGAAVDQPSSTGCTTRAPCSRPLRVGVGPPPISSAEAGWPGRSRPC